MLCVLCVCWSDCETSVEKSARFTYILQMSLACALAAHIEELPGRKVHLTSIVKKNEGCMYIHRCGKYHVPTYIISECINARQPNPVCILTIMRMYIRTCACTCVGHA